MTTIPKQKFTIVYLAIWCYRSNVVPALTKWHPKFSSELNYSMNICIYFIMETLAEIKIYQAVQLSQTFLGCTTVYCFWRASNFGRILFVIFSDVFFEGASDMWALSFYFVELSPTKQPYNNTLSFISTVLAKYWDYVLPLHMPLLLPIICW